MSLPSRQLFLDRFLEYNRIRYKDDPKLLARLNSITLSGIIFMGLTDDPDRPGGKVSNFLVPAPAIRAEIQRWIPADITEEKVTDPANVIPMEDLQAIMSGKARGLFQFPDEEGNPKFAVVMNYRSDIDASSLALNVIRFLNLKTNYRLLDEDLEYDENNSTDDYKVFQLRNDTIAGEITVVRLAGDIIAGTPWLGYMGEWTADEFIRGGVLAEMVGMPLNRVIEPEDLWLKFSVEGRIVYIAKRPISNFTSYAQLLGLNIVTGNRIVPIKDDDYKVRLLSGDDTEDSEWNKLIYRVSENDPTHTYWEEFTDTDLGLRQPKKGARSISRTTSGSSVYGRGEYGITNIQITGLTLSTAETGWRPALEMVGVENITDDPTVALEEILPVEPYIGDTINFVYTVGPIQARHYLDPANFVQADYTNVVFTMSIHAVKRPELNPAEFADFSCNNVWVVRAFDLKPLTTLKAALAKGILTDTIFTDRLKRILPLPFPLEGLTDEIEHTDPLYPVRYRRTLPLPFPVIEDIGVPESTNVTNSVLKTGKYVEAADFVIEEILFTGIEIYIVETDYLDLFDDPDADPETMVFTF